MRAKTEVEKRRAVDVIDANGLTGLLVDQLALQRLVALLEDAQRFSFRNLIATIGHVALGDVAHLLFDDGQISFRQSARGNYVVEKSVTWIFKQCRPNSQLGSGKQIQHRRLQQVRSRVS